MGGEGRGEGGLSNLKRSAVALICAALLTACPSRPKQVVYDLAQRTAVADRWSSREVVLFGTAGAEPYEAEGFYREAPGATRHEGFLWSKREAEVAFHWDIPRERAAVVDLAPYAGVHAQHVELRLNGTFLGGFGLNDTRHSYPIALPLAVQRSGDNRLRFVFSATASPATADPKDDDDRELAAAFHTLTIGNAGDPALDDLLRRDAPSPFAVDVVAQVPQLTLVGDAGVRYAVRLPAGAELRFTPELHAGAQAAAASALFKVTLEDASGRERELWSRTVAPSDRKPEETSVTLPGAKDAVVRLGLHVVGSGGGRFAWGVWRAPRILGRDAPAGLVPEPLSEEDDRRAERFRAGLKDTNVILIVLDAARAQEFSCYGYARKTTPEIDRLASEGVLFERAFTPAVYTLAAMSSIWTSQYPDRHHSAVAFSAPLPKDSFTLAGLLSAKTVRNAGFVANAVAGKAFGLNQGFQEFHEVFRDLGSDGDVFRHSVPAWLDAHKTERFFAYIHFREPHFPYDPKPPFDTRFGPDGPIAKALRRDSAYLLEVNQGRRPFPEPEREHLQRLYDGNLAFADAEIGFLRQELERLGLLEKTVVIVTGDHGEELFEHGYVGHNVQLYEESLHVPLVVRLPQSAGVKGQRVTALVDLLDVAPTITDVFGLGGQADVKRHFQGHSLLAVAAGAPGKGAVLSRTVWDRPRYALRDERYKLVYDTRTGEQELFDLQQDPQEQHDIAPREGLLTAYYRQALHQWIATVARRAPGAGPVPNAPPDCETCQNLKSLGYLSTDTKCPCP